MNSVRAILSLGDDEFQNILDERTRVALPLSKPEPKYHESFNEIAYDLALDGLEDRQIAADLGVSLKTFNEWLRKHPILRKRIEVARAQIDDDEHGGNSGKGTPTTGVPVGYAFLRAYDGSAMRAYDRSSMLMRVY